MTFFPLSSEGDDCSSATSLRVTVVEGPLTFVASPSTLSDTSLRQSRHGDTAAFRALPQSLGASSGGSPFVQTDPPRSERASNNLGSERSPEHASAIERFVPVTPRPPSELATSVSAPSSQGSQDGGSSASYGSSAGTVRGGMEGMDAAVADRVLQSLRAKDALIVELTEDVESLQRENTTLTETITAIRDEKDLLSEQLREALRNVSSLRTENESVRQELRLERESRARVAERQGPQCSSDVLGDDASRDRTMLSTELREKDRLLAQLKEELAYAQQRWEVKTVELEAQEACVAAQSSLSRRLEVQLGDLLHEKQQDSETLREHIRQLQRELRDKSKAMRRQEAQHRQVLSGVEAEMEALARQYETERASSFVAHSAGITHAYGHGCENANNDEQHPTRSLPETGEEMHPKAVKTTDVSEGSLPQSPSMPSQKRASSMERCRLLKYLEVLQREKIALLEAQERAQGDINASRIDAQALSHTIATTTLQLHRAEALIESHRKEVEALRTSLQEAHRIIVEKDRSISAMQDSAANQAEALLQVGAQRQGAVLEQVEDCVTATERMETALMKAEERRKCAELAAEQAMEERDRYRREVHTATAQAQREIIEHQELAAAMYHEKHHHVSLRLQQQAEVCAAVTNRLQEMCNRMEELESELATEKDAHTHDAARLQDREKEVRQLRCELVKSQEDLKETLETCVVAEAEGARLRESVSGLQVQLRQRVAREQRQAQTLQSILTTITQVGLHVDRCLPDGGDPACDVTVGAAASVADGAPDSTVFPKVPLLDATTHLSTSKARLISSECPQTPLDEAAPIHLEGDNTRNSSMPNLRRDSSTLPMEAALRGMHGAVRALLTERQSLQRSIQAKQADIAALLSKRRKEKEYWEAKDAGHQAKMEQLMRKHREEMRLKAEQAEASASTLEKRVREEMDNKLKECHAEYLRDGKQRQQRVRLLCRDMAEELLQFCAIFPALALDVAEQLNARPEAVPCEHSWLQRSPSGRSSRTTVPTVGMAIPSAPTSDSLGLQPREAIREDCDTIVQQVLGMGGGWNELSLVAAQVSTTPGGLSDTSTSTSCTSTGCVETPSRDMLHGESVHLSRLEHSPPIGKCACQTIPCRTRPWSHIWDEAGLRSEQESKQLEELQEGLRNYLSVRLLACLSVHGNDRRLTPTTLDDVHTSLMNTDRTSDSATVQHPSANVVKSRERPIRNVAPVAHAQHIWKTFLPRGHGDSSSRVSVFRRRKGHRQQNRATTSAKMVTSVDDSGEEMIEPLLPTLLAACAAHCAKQHFRVETNPA